MLADINLGEVLWSLLVLYLIFMYLIVVVTVIWDMFRSDDLSGWAKAAWMLALIALPFLALVAYLVARGDGLGMRNLARSGAATTGSVATAPPPPPPPPGPASELEKGKQLLDAGALSAAEYERLKAKLLS